MKKRMLNAGVFQGNLLLVNGSYPLRAACGREDLVPVAAQYPKALLKREAACYLRLLLSRVGGLSCIVPVSGYRPAQEQAEIYENSLAQNGEDFTQKYVARPSCSEHQTGLAIDLGLKKSAHDKIDFLCPDFPYDGICAQFRRYAPQYGFVERYPKGKEALTGIAHEPWHFRYTGYPHSLFISQNDLCLEEYVAFLKGFSQENPLRLPARGKTVTAYYVPAGGESAGLPSPNRAGRPGWPGQTSAAARFDCSDYAVCSGCSSCSVCSVCSSGGGYFARQVSGNNVDGFIVTLWGKGNE